MKVWAAAVVAAGMFLAWSERVSALDRRVRIVNESSRDIVAFYGVIVTERLWLQVGFYMLLFLAGLQRIPKDLYEAAAVDGARPGWQVFRFITFPQLRATSAAVLVLLLINAFQAFDEFFNLLSNPGAGTYPLSSG